MMDPERTPTPQRDRLWTLSLALVSVSYVMLCAWLTAPRFGANDNLTIVDFILHGYPVPYIGILFSRLLHTAYQISPSFPWYALSLYAFHALSLFLWMTLIRKVFTPWWAAMTLTAVLLVFYIQYLALLDYTSTSVMLCMSSLSYVLVEMVESRTSKWRFMLLGSVFMLGVMVRTDGALGALAFAFPIGMLAVLLRFDRYIPAGASRHANAAPPMAIWSLLPRIPWPALKAESLRLALIVILFFAPVVANLVMDTAWRQNSLTPQEARYDEFNAWRGVVLRSTNAQRSALMQSKPLLKAIHWNQVEMGHLLNWSYLDERIYTTDALRTIAGSITHDQITLQGLADAAGERFSLLDPQFLLLICPIPLFLLGIRRKPWSSACGLLLPLYCMALVGFMISRFTFLDRVAIPLVTAFGFSSLVMAATAVDISSLSGRLRDAALLIMLLIVLAGALPQAQKDSRVSGKNAGFHIRLDTKLQALDVAATGGVVLVQAGPGLIMEWSDPLAIRWPHFQTIDLGWSIYSPRYYETISALRIQHSYQLIDALVNRPDAYLLGTKGWCEDLRYFASDSAKRDIQVVAVKTFDDNTGLYRFEENKR